MEEFFKDWGGHILSSLGILGGLWAYIKHDRKLRDQEKRLNDFQIKQFEKAETEEKMADMKCFVIHGEKGNGRIRFYNDGKSNARNVRVEILSSDEDMRAVDVEDWKSYKVINPHSYREENLSLSIGCPDTIDLRIIWDDDYQQNRSVDLSVPL